MIDQNERVQSIINREASAIKNIPLNTSYIQAVNLIHQFVHEKNGKVITSGMGKAGQIAHNIATTLCSTGTPAVFLHPSEAQHGDLGIIQKNDILLLVSNSGKTREIIELIDLAQHLVPGIPYLLICGNPDSPLAENAAVNLLTGNPSEVCPLGLSPTTSITCMTVIGDILVVLMMDKIKFTSKDYAKRHHGGYLGHVSRNKSEE